MKTLNIGILAHVDAGKTSTVERMLYAAGAIGKPGSVDRGDTQTDWLAIERERGISVRAASTSIERDGMAINIIDTPGHMDFTGEVERALFALDAVVLVISAVDGVQPQTEKFWRGITGLSMPCIFFINKCDRPGVDLSAVIQDININLSKDTVYLTTANNAGTDEFESRPRSLSSLTDDEMLVCLEADEHAALALLDGTRPDDDSLVAAIRCGVAHGRLYPVVFGSAMLGQGIDELLGAVTGYLPASEQTDEGEPSGIIYMVEHDDRMGKAAHVRLYGGALRNRDVVEVYRPASEGVGEKKFEEKITQIRSVQGGGKKDSGTLSAGGVAAVYGLLRARAGDVIGDIARVSERLARSRRLALPLMSVKISSQPEKQNELIEAVSQLSDEDPLLDYEWNPDDRELSIRIMGRIQLEVISYLMKERFGLDVNFSNPSVIYRETPTKSGEGYEEYTMPKPCWAVVRLRIDPLPRGAGYEFESKVDNDAIYYRYQNHIAQSVPEALKQGLHGWQVTDLKVTLIGGEHHVVHTHNMDFFLATPIAVMDGLRNCGTTLLEPMLRMTLSAGEALAGRLIGDVLAMRGETSDSVIKDGRVHMEALVPAATSMEYPVTFASVTSGRGKISASFHGYRECPPELGATRRRNGINPLDRAKWILAKRGAVA